MKVMETEKEWLRRINGNKVKPDENNKQTKTKEIHQEVKANDITSEKGFTDVAGMHELKRFVTEGFINVLKNKECAKAYCIKPPSMLFYGPTGCGKTFFAEKMAEEVGIHFMKVVPDDLACTWVHGTQQKIGELFRSAEKKAPVLLFFDEFDAMVPQRSGDETNQYFNGEVNEFLCMLNNASERGIYVLAATNHPERIDKAVLRSGRIDEMIYIDMPDAEARNSLFRLALSNLPAEEDIDYERLASLTDGYTCSDICYIVKIASRTMFNASIKDAGQPYKKLTQGLLEDTISHRSPSVSSKELRKYELVRNEFSPKDENCKNKAIGFR